MALHLEYYTRPDLQKFVIRISWMVPFYSLDAWLSLRFFTAHVYVDPLRECYEAFVIYSFYSYLVAYLVSKVGNLEIHLLAKPEMEHIWGVQHLIRRWPMGSAYLWQCKKVRGLERSCGESGVGDIELCGTTAISSSIRDDQ